MTKLTQCVKCDYDRRRCGHYTPEDDTNCPHYARDGVLQGKKSKSNMGTIVSLAFFYVISSIFVYLRYFDDARVFYILSVPLVILAIWGVIDYFKNKHEQPKTENGKMEEDTPYVATPNPTITTRNLLQVVLRRLGIEYDFDEDNSFIVTYQGEHIRIVAKDDCRIIDLYDAWWYHAPLDDIDNLSLVHRAVNDCNIQRKAKFVYSYNTEDDVVGVHSMLHLLWEERIQNIDSYLRAHLDILLASHQHFYQIMERLRREENGVKTV